MQTLAAEDICKAYRGRRVVNGVSIRVGQGEVVGLLGPNGAGKTTTFYTIVGLIPSTRSGSSENAKLVSNSAIALALTSPKMSSFRDLDIGTPHEGLYS